MGIKKLRAVAVVAALIFSTGVKIEETGGLFH